MKLRSSTTFLLTSMILGFISAGIIVSYNNAWMYYFGLWAIQTATFVYIYNLHRDFDKWAEKQPLLPEERLGEDNDQ